jgi:hypothetical protein
MQLQFNTLFNHECNFDFYDHCKHINYATYYRSKRRVKGVFV